jgi:hypothetical protein
MVVTPLVLAVPMDTNVDRAIAEIAEEHHGVFSGPDLDLLKVPKDARHHRIATGRWQEMHEHVYRIAGSPPNWRGALLAACWAGGRRAVASHRSAAALWDLPAGNRDRVELTCPRWRRARHTGLVVHESTALPRGDVTEVDGIPCTTTARTLFDLARVVRPMALDLNLDNALRRNLTTIPELNELCERLARRGRPGSQAFRAALLGRGPQTRVPESPPERLLAKYLTEQGLPAPVFQYEVRERDGTLVARTDLAYPIWRLVIEYDSFQEHLGKIPLVRDAARRNSITRAGFTPLVATHADIVDRGRQLARTIHEIGSRAA